MNTEVRKALDRWFDEFRQALKDPESWDGGHTVIALPPQMIARILTEKRADLLEILQQRPIHSVSELAQLTGRKVESVSRDLKILHTWGFIRYERHGKCKQPVAVAQYVLIKVGETQPQVSVPKQHTPTIYSYPRSITQRVPTSRAFRKVMVGRAAKRKTR